GPDVPLREGQAQLRGHRRYHLAHDLAEMAPGLADEEERLGRHVRGGCAGAGVASGGRRSVTTAATAITVTMVSCTARAVRSGWMPIHGTSGNGTGRGRR